jgi:hypothetical protein
MSSRGAGPHAQSRVVYAAGLVQGIVQVTFPAASTIFTSASSYGLSSSQYGGMFLPQAITAIGSSLLQETSATGSAESRCTWPAWARTWPP